MGRAFKSPGLAIVAWKQWKTQEPPDGIYRQDYTQAEQRNEHELFPPSLEEPCHSAKQRIASRPEQPARQDDQHEREQKNHIVKEKGLHDP